MAPDSNDKRSNRIPIRCVDAENESDPPVDSNPADMDRLDPDNDIDSSEEDNELESMTGGQDETPVFELDGGPVTAELVATRSELRRVQEENAELRDRL